MKDVDWLTQALLFLAVLCGMLALWKSDIPSFVHDEVVQLVINIDDRYQHEEAPTVPAGRRGNTLEEPR